MKLNVSAMKPHANRVPFEGRMVIVDCASTQSPFGARGRKIYLSRKAVREALSSLLGMGVCASVCLTKHDARRKCGLITEAVLSGSEVIIRGFVYGKDFPDVHARLQSGGMGISFEAAETHIEDLRAAIYQVTKITFTGAAILEKAHAAYPASTIRLSQVSGSHGAVSVG